MAELAAGAVSSLLGVLKNEAQLLQRVGHDVVFIKEEMESMNSFLEHLARTAPPSGSHDEQVRTWMKQVRDLAHDCSSCIDGYLQRGDPAIHRARGGFRGYVWCAYWFVEELFAKHKAAAQLRELKERASDVGKRRLRYGVEIPGKATTTTTGGSSAAGSPAPAAAASASFSSSSQPAAGLLATAADDDEDDEEDGGRYGGGAAAANACSSYYYHHQALEPPTLDNYFLEKVANWAAEASQAQARESMPSIAIVEPSDAGAIVTEGLTRARAQFKRTVWINLSMVHLQYDKLGTNRVLCYILRACQLQNDHHNDQNYYKEEGISSSTPWAAWGHKWRTKRRIMERIKASVDGKVTELDIKINDMETQINERRGEGNKISITGKESTAEKGTETTGKSSKVEDAGARTADGKERTEVTETETTGKSSKVEDEGPGNKAEEKKTKQADVSLVLTDRPLGMLYQALLSEEDKKNNFAKDVLRVDDETLIMKTADKLKQHMGNSPICLHDTQYQGILRELFLTSKPHQVAAQEAAGTTTTTTTTTAGGRAATLGGDQMKEIMGEIKEIIRIVKQDIKEEMDLTKSHHLRGEQNLGHDDIVCAIQDVKDKIAQISAKIKMQMVVKGIVDEIDERLGEKHTLIVLEDENRRRGPKWEDIIKAMKLLKCAKGSAVVVTTKNSGKAKEFCCPPAEPITYSLVGLYHDSVLKLTRKSANNEDDSNKSQILRHVLEKCHPHESCMKMFARALYANPNRSREELVRLCDSLQVSENSLATNAAKIFKFSYKDLPREHKTCLLYLAIFPPDKDIRRSVLVARWLTEGLITKEDWPTAVRHAKQCFNALIDRMLVSPGALSDRGEYKSCVVSALVHGFITKIAKKQHILDARLSDLLARHFSIFCGLRLRASDSICTFVHNLHNFSPQLSLLKLLDLQGCQCFDKKKYLRAICNNISLLKYLSLRDTNVTHLPMEINKLHDLEILDIRQTKVPKNATRHVLLLKLRRLLAGGTCPSRSSIGIGPSNCKEKSLCSSVEIPSKIEKMENIEVLSNVMASMYGNELEDIRKLWQLRKLGVVINDNDRHIVNLLQVIGDLKECLQSLSITIPETRSDDIPREKRILSGDLYRHLVQPPKHLVSVTIKGHARTIRLLSLLAKGSDGLDKVALIGTMLQVESHLKVVAGLPNLCCVSLRHDAYKHDALTFKIDEFEHLKCLHVEGQNMTKIEFEEGAAVELEKIVLSSTNLKYLRGVGRLPMLKELVMKGNELLFVASSEDRGAHQQNTVSVSPSSEVGAAPQESAESMAASEGVAPQQNNLPTSTSEGGAAPQENTALVSHTEVGAAPQKNTEVGAAPQKSVESISPSEGVAPQQNNLPASTSEGGAAPQENTALVSPTEVGAAPQNSAGSISASEDGAASGKTNQFVPPTQDGEAPQKKRERKITFKEEEYQHLKYFTFEDSEMIEIIFHDGAAPELEKIILSLGSNQSQLTVRARLPRLKEIVLTGDKSILHSLFNDFNKIEKVTLCGTLLKQGDLEFLAKRPYICCLVLLENSYDDSQLTFKEADFPKLNLLCVNCSKIKEISFQDGCAPNLEKVVLSFVAAFESLSGIDRVQKLKELELNGDPGTPLLRQVKKDIRAHKRKPVLVIIISKEPQHPDQDREHETEEGEGSWFGRVPIPMASCFSMKKDHQSSLADDQRN
ncbi:hypothetical protein BS78_05G198500 [Paspalum vaginatum]|nr:hypothetical protein BS78_05G198500 [Paspalum vaginatum]